jgi:hypothetical protein
VLQSGSNEKTREKEMFPIIGRNMKSVIKLRMGKGLLMRVFFKEIHFRLQYVADSEMYVTYKIIFCSASASFLLVPLLLSDKVLDVHRFGLNHVPPSHFNNTDISECVENMFRFFRRSLST